MKKKRKKIKWKNLILLFIMLICFITFVVSGYKVIYRLKEKRETDKLIENINSLVNIEESNPLEKEEIEDSDKIELEESAEDIKEQINYYYEYLSVPFMFVNFSNLKSINSDVIGWINVVGAGINYPYVKTEDNDYYLTHSFDKSINSSGWVFLDYRNDLNNQDKNSIIYAHGGNSMAMFGPLKNLYNKKDWFNNPNNHYIKISTEKYNLVYKVFSLYVIPTTSDYLKISFDDDEYSLFLDKIKNRSYYDFKTEVSNIDRIITLSTCYNKKDKLVLHGKLIKQEYN